MAVLLRRPRYGVTAGRREHVRAAPAVGRPLDRAEISQENQPQPRCRLHRSSTARCNSPERRHAMYFA